VTLRQERDDLANLKNGITPQTRGRKFERWLNQLLSEENLEPRTAYRPKGEEVDGSFIYRDRTYLIEAKWIADEVLASTIYQFKGKVDGKLVGHNRNFHLDVGIQYRFSQCAPCRQGTERHPFRQRGHRSHT
jgi:hypothetical protein